MLRLARLLWLTRRPGRLSGLPWLVLRLAVLALDGCRCRKYGHTVSDPRRLGELHVDHIKPLSEGGSNRLGNLRVLCETCHKRRHRWM